MMCLCLRCDCSGSVLNASAVLCTVQPSGPPCDVLARQCCALWLYVFSSRHSDAGSGPECGRRAALSANTAYLAWLSVTRSIVPVASLVIVNSRVTSRYTSTRVSVSSNNIGRMETFNVLRFNDVTSRLPLLDVLSRGKHMCLCM